LIQYLYNYISALLFTVSSIHSVESDYFFQTFCAGFYSIRNNWLYLPDQLGHLVRHSPTLFEVSGKLHLWEINERIIG